ncbi:MAG: glycogen/starch/alpha-glucan phosphorylase [Selenomonadales bacterium]|nr:glycogen/starch/alpha-glucan phosphorylase [Selenomonadales bacterium]
MLKNKETFKTAFINKLQTMCAGNLETTGKYEKYQALVGVIRDHISRNWLNTNVTYKKEDRKQVYYFSIEFLIGRLMESNLVNTGLRDVCEEGLAELGIDLADILNEDPEAGLGNGGLGRLAACFLDSLASLGIPGHGNGLRYRVGLFEQKIFRNQQVELPDAWLKDGYMWEYRRADKAVEVRFGGHVESERQADGSVKFIHKNYHNVRAVPYDVPIIGYDRATVNTLRLWSAEPMMRDFMMSSYSGEEYRQAAEYKRRVEQISQQLYPDDSSFDGRQLRLYQEYFFTSAGIKSILRSYKKRGGNMKRLHEKVAIHINDTHPAVAVPELMRILIDEENMSWDEAFHITMNTIAYTNHTILPEALERWPIPMFKELLPRIYMIIDELNNRLKRSIVERYGNENHCKDLCILWDGQVHMARLAVIGSHSINGVAQIHSDIVKDNLMHEFYRLYPERFNNKTNGITHRRWLIKSNPELTALLDRKLGADWKKEPHLMEGLMDYVDDEVVQETFAAIKRKKKEALAAYIEKHNGVKVSVDSIFDIQIKRIHSYKRQIMNALRVLDLYNRLRENPDMEMVPRTVIFAGKAAPGYHIAKLTIQLINCIAEKVNNDKTIGDKLKVVFLENYNVSLGEMLFPAADISEQISTASKEASGTGNMKFMMNGAITIGTMDGANVEIYQEVGEDNIVIFGLRADEVMRYYEQGGYSAWDEYHKNRRLKTVLEQLVDGFFAKEGDAFRPLYDYLLYNNDEFFVLKDFAVYCAAQEEVDRRYLDTKAWRRSALINIARSGFFSSDRTIRQYAEDIWDAETCDIK